MKLVLDGKYSGGQILEAFKKTASIKISSEEKWTVEKISQKKEDVARYKIVEGHLNLLPPEYEGLAIYQSFLIKRRALILTGEKKSYWSKNVDIILIIEPLDIKEKYKRTSGEYFNITNN